MKTIQSELEDINEKILETESRIRDVKITKKYIDQVQEELDSLEKQIKQREFVVEPEQHSNMLELQALVLFSQGKVSEARKIVHAACIEAKSSDYLVSSIATDLNVDRPGTSVKSAKVRKDIPSYYTVSNVRLILLSIITLDMYSRYWAYKNWKGIQTTIDNGDEWGHENTHPVLSAMFFPIFSYGLYTKVRDSKKKLSKEAKMQSGLYAVAIFLSSYFCLSFLVIGLSQKHLNEVKQSAFGDKDVRKGTSWGEVAYVLICASVLPIYIAAIVASINTGSSVVPDKAAEADKLTQQYDACSRNLERLRGTVDNTSQFSVNSFNAQVQSCEEIRLQQNRAVEEYNTLIGQ